MGVVRPCSRGTVLRLWRSLWWKLSLGAILVTLGSGLASMLVMGPLLDAQAFRQMVAPKHLHQLIEPELRVLNGRQGDPALVALMLDAMQQRLLNVDGPEGYYGIRASSEPRVSLALYDARGQRRERREDHALPLPAQWSPGPQRLEQVSPAERLLALPLEGGGSLLVRHHAGFDTLRNMRSTLRDVADSYDWWLLLVGLPGVLLGILLTRWLSHRLGRLAGLTEAWAGGDFSARSTDVSRDELGEHARALNRLADQLQAQVQTGRDLAALQERQRLARELHDSIKQQVFATGLQLHAARQWLERQPERAAALLAEAATQNQAVHRDLADLLTRLKPAQAERCPDLARAMSERLAPWRGLLELDLDLPPGLALPATQARELASLANEAVANALRHGRARRVHLAWRLAAGWAELRIEDEGRGFDPARPSAGQGLANMRERAELLPEGSLSVDAAPGEGCRLCLRWRWQPLDAETPQEASDTP